MPKTHAEDPRMNVKMPRILAARLDQFLILKRNCLRCKSDVIVEAVTEFLARNNS